MPILPRRDFLHHSLAASALAFSPRLIAQAVQRETTSARGLHIAPFRFDVTPPKGHGCCGGWIKPVTDVDDPLEAIGYVLLGAGDPLVFCTVDWTGLLNTAHLEWRTALAQGAGTTPDRVAVHCVHQHNAPLVCPDAQRLLSPQTDLPKTFETDFFRTCLDRGRAAVSAAVPKAMPVTHIARGEAPVIEVAANRRVSRGANGRILAMRGSSCKDPALIALPEGLIDPQLRTIAWYAGEKKVVSCHYYATHPMSYYGDGRVTADFCGLARRRREQDEPGCTHLYFTGCAGNIAAGRYNDGTPAARVRLTRRIYDGIVASEAKLRREPIGRFEWRTQQFVPAPNPAIVIDALEELITKRKDAPVLRMRPAFKLSFIQRCQRGQPFVLGALHVNDVASLYLPAEPFIEYQLRAHQIAGRPVAVAAYGDAGPWYIPTQPEFPSGGYEVEHAFARPETDDALTQALTALLA
ncbi:MAG: hypothetical protein WCQ89_21085 [Verrucomicrobiota bacterium]